MNIDFTVLFKRYISIIIIILMRKYYTLVKNGRQEGVGAGNKEVSALLPASCHRDFPSNRKTINIFPHSLLLSRIFPV